MASVPLSFAATGDTVSEAHTHNWPGQMGMFGKIPERGDFISAGLPRAFMDKFEAWARSGLQLAAQREDWHAQYLSSPIWQFGAAPYVLGQSAWCGVLVPSVDSVGRNFPLIIAVPTDEISIDLLDRAKMHALTALHRQYETVDAWKTDLLGLKQAGLDVTDIFSAPVTGVHFQATNLDGSILAEHRGDSLSADLYARLIGWVAEDNANQAGGLLW